jgi:hypothetical protein
VENPWSDLQVVANASPQLSCVSDLCGWQHPLPFELHPSTLRRAQSRTKLMSENDADYLANYKADHLYTHPAKNGAGAFATIVGESEEVLGEINVTSRCRLVVTAFHVREKNDFGSLKLKKLQYHATHGWREVEAIQLNHFQLAQMREFLGIISALDLGDVQKTRISLENISVGALATLLHSTSGASIIRQLAETPALTQDIYAVARKREALAEFEKNLAADTSESEWQTFFENNQWIFGHGLHYVSLTKVGAKLEVTTTGSAFDAPGKRADALVRTRAEVSQYVLVEIKKHSTPLLRSQPYRTGCWSVSDEVSNAVTQVQKTAFDFVQGRFRDRLKDEQGNDTDQTVYAIEPRTFLVIGNTAQLAGNDDKVTCFELFRKNVRSPEVLTFDELFYRAKFIVEHLSQKDD